MGHKVQSVQAKLVQPCSVDVTATKADLRMLYAVLKGVRRSMVNRHKDLHTAAGTGTAD